MKRSYFCPHCKAVLNPGTKLVLRGEMDHLRCLMLFSPQPGNYDVVIPEGFRLRKKDVVRFDCPVCNADLTSRRDGALAEISFRAANGAEGSVLFSKVYGRHATYFVTEEKVATYGEHAGAPPVNFWGAGPEED